MSKEVNKKTSKKRSRNFFGSSHKAKSARAFYILLAPALIMFLVAKLWPFIWGIEKSFTNYNGFNIDTLKNVGFANYTRVFSDNEAMSSLLRTLGIGCIVVPITLIACNAMALLLTSFNKGVGIFRTIFYFPSIVPLVAATTMWQGILMKDGVLNTVIGLIGIPPINWLGYDFAKVSLVLLMLWSSGAGIISNIAAINSIPKDLFEAAELDGAGYWQRVFKITLPMTANMNFLNLTTGIIGTLQLFGEPVLLSGASLTGVPLRSIYTYLVHVYQQIFVNLRFGYGLALTWFVFLIIVISTSIVQYVNKKVLER